MDARTLGALLFRESTKGMRGLPERSARITLNMQCPACGAREAHFDFALPFALGKTIDVEVTCVNEATCGRVVRFPDTAVRETPPLEAE